MEEIRTCYAIQNKKNLKMYIGLTKNLQKRISQHLCLLKRGKHKSQLFQKEFNESGLENFQVFILEKNLPWDKAYKIELDYMVKYKTYDEKYGYNTNERIKIMGHAEKFLKFNIVEGLPKTLLD